jgi:acyl-CoA thioesterase-1
MIRRGTDAEKQGIDFVDKNSYFESGKTQRKPRPETIQRSAGSEPDQRMERNDEMTKRACILLILGSLAGFASAGTDTTRVVCVGNSITEGATTATPALDAYPIQAGALLGKNWMIKNSGVSGRTMLRNGDDPIWKEQRFKEGLAFSPDIVTICLGTNDSKPYNWIYKDEFIPDYSAMIDTFRALPSHPVVWIALPPPAFKVNFDIRDSIITTDIIPMLLQLAVDKGCPIIDFNTPMKDDSKLFPDGIHPNVEGQAIMAMILYEALTGKNAMQTVDENLALGRPVEASGSLDAASGPENLTDGKRSTFWKAAGFPSSAVVDLGSVQTVDLFSVDFGTAAGAGYRYLLETGQTAGVWITVADRTARTDTSAVAFEPVDSLQVRYVRLTVTGSSLPSEDKPAVSELRILKANDGVHAPTVLGRLVKYVSSTAQVELTSLSPSGAEGASMYYRRVSNDSLFRQMVGFRAGGSFTKLEYVKKGFSVKYYVFFFLNGLWLTSDTIQVETQASDVSERANQGVPSGFMLHPAYPNPFNPATTVTFEIPSPAHSRVMICDVRGRLVRVLADRDFTAGVHRISWDATDGSDRPVSAGVYVVRLEAEGVSLARKILLVR